MKDYNSDSTVVLDRFARDKRKRTTTAERIERRPGPRRDADDTPREHAPRRASYNPHFTEDNRPVDERPRRPSGGSRYGEGRPSGPYRGRPDGPRSDRSGGYGGERSAAEDRPRPYGKKPFGASKYGDKPAYGRKSAGKFGFKRPYGFPSRRTCGCAETLRSEVRGRIQARRSPRRGAAQELSPL